MAAVLEDVDGPIAVDAFGRKIRCHQPIACLCFIGKTCQACGNLRDCHCGHYNKIRPHIEVSCERFIPIHTRCPCRLLGKRGREYHKFAKCVGKNNTCTGAKILGEMGKKQPVHCHSCVNEWRRHKARDGEWEPLPQYAVMPVYRKQFMKQKLAAKRKHREAYEQFVLDKEKVASTSEILKTFIHGDAVGIIKMCLW